MSNRDATVLRQWLVLAARRSVVRRGLAYAAVVGPVLIAINHGDTIARGDVTGVDAIKMSLTVIVPYLVSTFSSVGAMRLASGSEVKSRQRRG